MPSLLDLPVELIEQIYDDYEELRADSYAEDEDDSEGPLGQFRLVCRYLQSSTRRAFAHIYFDWRQMRKDDNVWLQRTLAIARTPEFAKAVTRLIMDLPDSGSVSRCETDVDTDNPGSESDAEDLARVRQSAAPIWTTAEFAEILRSFVNLTQVEICDPHAVRPKIYKTYRPAPIENDYYVYDVSSSFNDIVRMMDSCGRSPKWLSLHPGNECCVRMGSSDFSSFLSSTTFLSRLEWFEMHFFDDWRTPHTTPDQAGRHVGRQLAQAFANMPALKKLHLLAQGTRTSVPAFKELVKGPILPNLTDLIIWCGEVDCADFTMFVRKHLRTLETLTLDFVEFQNGSEDDLQLFLHHLRDAALTRKLTHFDAMKLRLNDSYVHFPIRIYDLDLDDPDFAEWVMVTCSSNAFLKDKEEIIEGLELMIGGMEVW